MKPARPVWRQAAPYVPDPGWYTALILLRDVSILLSLMLGIPFLLWLVAA